MNRYGQIRDMLLGDITAFIFIFGIIVTMLVVMSFFLSKKEKISDEKDYYDRFGSQPK
ncbi:MAG: hypothetical protein O3C31_05165 [Bacteroidetes bacterium]|nr:hypothetical protein [Bacteroidota bacterium]